MGGEIGWNPTCPKRLYQNAYAYQKGASTLKVSGTLD